MTIHNPRRRKIEWPPLPKLIVYLAAVAILITILPRVIPPQNGVLFAFTIPALVWLVAEMRRLK